MTHVRAEYIVQPLFGVFTRSLVLSIAHMLSYHAERLLCDGGGRPHGSRNLIPDQPLDPLLALEYVVVLRRGDGVLHVCKRVVADVEDFKLNGLWKSNKSIQMMTTATTVKTKEKMI